MVATKHSEAARKPAAVRGNVAEVPLNLPTLRANLPMLRANLPMLRANLPMLRTNLPTLRTNNPAAPRIARVARPIVPRNHGKVAAERCNLQVEPRSLQAQRHNLQA